MAEPASGGGGIRARLLERLFVEITLQRTQTKFRMEFRNRTKLGALLGGILIFGHAAAGQDHRQDRGENYAEERATATTSVHCCFLSIVKPTPYFSNARTYPSS